jgi:hypothetical protein
MSHHRRGFGQIQSATELSKLLAIPLFYILVEKAQAIFPDTATPTPSGFVVVKPTTSGLDPNHISKFPVYVNWRQWNEIIVPMLLDPKFQAWIGHYGLGTGLTEDGYPSTLPSTQGGPGLFSCNASLRAEFVRLLGEEVRLRAVEAGY